MEIFHAFGIDWRLLLIQAVNFGVLMLVLWKFLYTPLLKLLDDRRTVIEKGVKDADAAAHKLHKAEEQKREIMTAAEKDASALQERARVAVVQYEKKMQEESAEKAARVLEAAEREGKEMKDAALSSAKQELAKLIVLGAEKTMRTSTK